MERRLAIKWMLAAAASTAFGISGGIGAGSTVAGQGPAAGYGTDPDLQRDYHPGDLWPLTFDGNQRRIAARLCDLIIPADAESPSATQVGVDKFIDEWISAPYLGHLEDRKVVLAGLAWISAESVRRFGADFPDLVLSQCNSLCDDICYLQKARPEHMEGAHFFKRFRDLVAGGFYTTQEGMRDIGYVGNVPSASFDGPPESALKMLGLN